MDKNSIKEKLDRLDDMYAQATVINMHYDELRNGILTEKIRNELDEIEAERSTTLESVQEGIGKLEAEIKDGVLLVGESIKGAHIQAVWNKARVSWDTRALDGFAAAHPEILTMRKIGKPSVSLRKVS